MSIVKILTGLLLALAPVRCEIIDRMVAAVGRSVITWSDVQREARLEAFFDAKPPPAPLVPDENYRKLLERLIDQRLLRQEMEQISFVTTDSAQVKAWLDQNRPPGADPKAYELREEDLMDYGHRVLDVRRFLELRFRPGAQLAPGEVESYYEKTLLPELQRQGIAERPRLEDVRGQIEKIRIEERTNELLDAWLKEARSRTRIRLVDIEP